MSDTPMMDALKEAVARDAEIMRLRAGIERIRERLSLVDYMWPNSQRTDVTAIISICDKLLDGELK